MTNPIDSPAASIQVRTRYTKGEGTTLLLKYPTREAEEMRTAALSIRLKGDKQPSLSLLARRSMRLYLEMLNASPAALAAEHAALERLATPVSYRSKRKVPAVVSAVMPG